MLDFPAATAAKGGRAFEYEISIEEKAESKKPVKKYLLAQGYNMSTDNPRTKRPQQCSIASDQLPQNGDFRFSVRPVNSLLKAGRPIVSRWLNVGRV